MTTVTTQPRKRLLYFSAFARWVWFVTVGFWILVTAAWLIFDILIVPRIGNYRMQLQEWASKVTDVPITIGGLTAHQDGLLPWIELSQLTVGARQGEQPPLALKKVIVTFSPRSLLRLGVEQLVIDEPTLDIRRDAQGQITVAGFAVSGSGDRADPTQWLMKQKEIVVRQGTLRWIDAQRNAPALVLSDVDIVLRNGTWRHALRVDAKPPAQWGEHMTFLGRFHDPLLQLGRQDWRQWSGQSYIRFDRLDLASLSQYTDMARGIEQGHGALRAWIDLQRGKVAGAVVDMAIQQAKVKLDDGLEPLDLRQITGRVHTKIASDRFAVWTQNLRFTTQDDVQWPGGNVRFEHIAAKAKSPEQASFTADALDLGVLAHIADRIPLHTQVRESLHTYRPRGRVETVQSTWAGPIDAPLRYAVHVKANGLAMASDTDAQNQSAFGFSGLGVDLKITERGGKGVVHMQDGYLWLPKVFEEAKLPLDMFNAQLQWDKVEDASAGRSPYWKVQAQQVRFSNADAQGEAQVMWRSDVPTHASTSATTKTTAPSQGSAGYLDLSGSLSRADTTRVHRYLPLSIPDSARHYVRDAIASGTSKKVTFKVKGDVAHLPSHDGKNNEFRIAAQVQDVTYRYVPPALQDTKASPWPALTQLQGELIFQGSSMLVRNAKSNVDGLAGLKMSNIQAKIADLNHTKVVVNAEAAGPLDEMLSMVRTSPVAQMTNRALDQARAKGSSKLQLALQLPISALEQSEVEGAVTLVGNEVQIMPQVPVLTQAQGRITFGSQGFALQGVQARALGGAVRLEGGMVASKTGAEPTVQIQAQGVATAQGLQSMTQWGTLTTLMQKASGSANYSMQLAVKNGIPELLIASPLEGLELALPEPLRKKAEQVWPLRVQTKVTAPRAISDNKSARAGLAEGQKPVFDTVTISIKDKLMGMYERQHSGDGVSRVLRGGWVVGSGGADAPQMPAQGVSAAADFQGLDVDAWLAALTAMRLVPPANATIPVPAYQLGFEAYLPETIRLKAQQLSWQGRTFRDVSSYFARDADKWRADLDAKEFKGYAEYRPAKVTATSPSAGEGGGNAASDRVYARLSRLLIPPAEGVSKVDAQPNQLGGAQMQAKLPAIDVEVDRFVMHGKEWGRLTLKAENQSRAGAPQEWRLHTLQITNPESQLTATGNWAPIGGGALGANAERRTVLNFSLDVSDAGGLLARFGMPDVVRKGHGQLAGQMAWIGNPFSPDTPTMTGQMHLDIGTGQFLQAEPGVAKLLSVLSLQSLPRRFALDFRDVFSKGFAFDFVRGDVRVNQGIASTNNLQMKGVNAAVLMEGTADIQAETQNLRVVVVPEINAMTASLVATAINPVIGLGSFLAQVFLRGPLIEAATQELHIDGTWSEPKVTKIDRRTGAARSTPAPATAPPIDNASGEVAVDTPRKNEVQP